MNQAHPAFLATDVQPIRRAGEGRGQRRDAPEEDQLVGRLARLPGREEVQEPRRDPRADHHVREDGVQRMADPRPGQDVLQRPFGQVRLEELADLLSRLVQGLDPFDALGDRSELEHVPELLPAACPDDGSASFLTRAIVRAPASNISGPAGTESHGRQSASVFRGPGPGTNRPEWPDARHAPHRRLRTTRSGPPGRPASAT